MLSSFLLFTLLLINILIFDYPDSRLSGLFTEVPTSPDNRGSTVFRLVPSIPDNRGSTVLVFGGCVGTAY